MADKKTATTTAPTGTPNVEIAATRRQAWAEELAERQAAYQRYSQDHAANRTPQGQGALRKKMDAAREAVKEAEAELAHWTAISEGKPTPKADAKAADAKAAPAEAPGTQQPTPERRNPVKDTLSRGKPSKAEVAAAPGRIRPEPGKAPGPRPADKPTPAQLAAQVAQGKAAKAAATAGTANQPPAVQAAVQAAVKGTAKTPRKDRPTEKVAARAAKRLENDPRAATRPNPVPTPVTVTARAASKPATVTPPKPTGAVKVPATTTVATPDTSTQAATTTSKGPGRPPGRPPGSKKTAPLKAADKGQSKDGRKWADRLHWLASDIAGLTVGQLHVLNALHKADVRRENAVSMVKLKELVGVDPGQGQRWGIPQLEEAELIVVTLSPDGSLPKEDGRQKKYYYLTRKGRSLVEKSRKTAEAKLEVEQTQQQPETAPETKAPTSKDKPAKATAKGTTAKGTAPEPAPF